MIEELVAIALESLACTADAAILRSGKLTAEQGRRFLDELEKLPPLSGMKVKVDQGERFLGLDAIQSLARTQGKSFSTLMESSGSDLSFLFKASFDWNATLELMNKEYDTVAGLLDQTDPQLARSKLQAYKKRMAELTARNKEVSAQSWLALVLSTKERGRKLGEILIGLLMPAFDAALGAEHRGQARLAVTRMGFAVELYRLENCRYPDSLKDLTPNLLKSIPVDPFGQKPLTYRKDAASGFVVYSIGLNEKDNDGRFRKDDKEPADWDDIAIQGPSAK